MTTIIQLNQLSFAYGNRTVLSNLDLTVQEGEILGLVGPNGAGKTTLINLIQGVLTTTPGSVTVFGGQPGTRRAKSKIATMFQDDLKLDNVTVTEFLNVFASQADHPKELVTLVNELNLNDKCQPAIRKTFRWPAAESQLRQCRDCQSPITLSG
ncbi:hypothetical protein HMPREF9103_00210 [Lentilactobacillus parafarraginis F0439]|uniref:ABC transporter domain-containing protein n=1 Tax=Lentilactobacillus parafarraginis F0439 TaxID=797515 RepID=G9ZKG2_9LACO|nr:ATP-binding cassette domain-containing protein [Lentilactobacillus parafarraginis]EHM01091.1 hypothetical protein HMPREF9103_00210 [Lentilactobacillus parafarraginis F0439]